MIIIIIPVKIVMMMMPVRGNPFLRMHLWWSLCTLYLLAYQAPNATHVFVFVFG